MNKRIVVVCFAFVLSSLSCMKSSQTNPIQSSQSQASAGTVVMNISNGDGALAKTVIDTELVGVQHVWLTIKQVDLHTSDSNWVTAAQPNARFDFLSLINGLTIPLNLYPLPAGHYTQIRLILAEDCESSDGTVPANEIVVNGESFPISIPSGIQTGIKCVHQFTIEPNEFTEICIQFDILKAIKYNNGKGYTMKPAYKTIKCDGDYRG